MHPYPSTFALKDYLVLRLLPRGTIWPLAAEQLVFLTRMLKISLLANLKQYFILKLSTMQKKRIVNVDVDVLNVRNWF